jgi:hypothetical protein
MEMVFTDIQTQVALGLAKAAGLDKFLSVATTNDPSPFRVPELTWARDARRDALRGHKATPATKPKKDHVELLQCTGETQWALDLVVTHDYALVGFYKATPNDEIWEFGNRARILERRLAMKLIADDARRIRGHSETLIDKHLKELDGKCRLICDDDGITTQATDANLVEEAISSEDTLPKGVEALLVPLAECPVIEHVVDADLTLTWERVGFDGDATTPQVRLVLAERLFFSPGSACLRFDSA